MKEEAFSVVETLTLDGESLPAGICLFDPNWHQGVVGLVASRVKDKWHRPTIAFAFADASRGDKELKGSARSIGGIHIRDVLETIDNRHPDLIEKFGGHAMAAGLSLKANQLSNFKTAFNLRVEEVITEEQLYAQLVTDGELEEAWFKLEVAEMLAAAGPWGQGFPEPTFHGDFSVVQHRRVGANHLKLVLRSSSNSPELLDAIAFNIDEEDWPKDNIESMRIVFRLDINEYRGVRRLQLLIQYIIEMN
jgi:single-stranded-DNA-specific exonuclease